MRIEKIEINNYRQYRQVTYTFSKHKEFDLHIIKGKNGMGKTNLLNAIAWCLYNKEPHLGIKNSGKPKINISALKEARLLGEDRCKICVRITISDNSKSIIFERSQECTTENEDFEYKPEFSVTYMNGSKDVDIYTDQDTCNRYVNLYMPQDIREYFFFDGEHLEKYFINEQGEKIKNAIHMISQVRLLTSMKDRLKAIIDEYNREAGKKNKNISGLIIKQQNLENEICKKTSEIAELQRQIMLSENIVNECNEFLRGKEGVPEKEKEFEELQSELINANQEKESLDIEVHKFIRRYKILFSFYPAIKQTYNIICTKEKDGVFPPIVDKDFLKRMLLSHKCLVCDRELCQHDETKIEELLRHVSVANGASHILHGIKGELEGAIEETKDYITQKEILYNKRKKLEKQIDKLEKHINRLDSELKQFNDKETIKEKHEKRMNHSKILEENRSKKLKYEMENFQMSKELEEVQKQIKRARTSIEEFEELNRKITFADDAKRIVTEIEEEMMNEVREKITEETMAIFKELEWKKNSFSHITLDQNYNLELYDTDGYPTVGTCSAGERALLALSFTLALQKVAGYDSMLFIDTPVGRIDTENRNNFAKVLANVSKNKQVIITLTTSEYSKEIQAVFEPINSSFVELITSDEQQTILMEE